MEWMILPLKRYFDFRGRSRRKEFWMWVLFTVIANIVLSAADAALGLGGSMSGNSNLGADGSSMGAAGALKGGLLASLFALATFIPSVAVSVRRLHDINRTGWWIVFPLVFSVTGFVLMFAGAMSGLGGTTVAVGTGILVLGVLSLLLLLIWYFMAGTAGPNRFGEDPKAPFTNAEEVFG